MHFKKTALIRVDASTQIGTGHVYRCLTIADGLRGAGYHCHFVCREHIGHLGGLVAQKGFELTLLPVETAEAESTLNPSYNSWLGAGWKSDAEQTKQVLSTKFGSKVDLLVVDHYALDADWHHVLRELCQRLLVVDDLANRSLLADWVLDQTYGRRDTDYTPWVINPHSTLLLGAGYALLRSEFSALRATALSRRLRAVSKPRLLITLGGADPANLSAQLLHTLGASFTPEELSVDLVVGLSNPNVPELKRLVSCSPVEVNLHVATDRIAELMVNSDLAIGAAGTTSWERCTLGLPTLTICLADNQRNVLNVLKDCGAVIELDLADISEPAKLRAAVQGALNNRVRISENAAAVCDGLGTKRVLMQLLDETTRDGRKLRLRMADESDCRMLYGWQCAPETRKFARNPSVPTWEEHQNWFMSKLKQHDALLSFMLLEDKPVGMLRLDPVEGGTSYEISILVDPDYYRLGIAEAGLTLLRNLYPERQFLATVLEENTASHKLFQRLGYQLISSTQYKLPPLE